MLQCHLQLLNVYRVFNNNHNHAYKEGKSAASFCRQVAGLVRGTFCNFYLVKNHKIAKTSTTTAAQINSCDPGHTN